MCTYYRPSIPFPRRSISITRFPAFTKSTISRRDRSPVLGNGFARPYSKYYVRCNELTWNDSSHSLVTELQGRRNDLSFIAKATRPRLTIGHLVWPSREKGRCFPEDPAIAFAIYRGLILASIPSTAQSIIPPQTSWFSHLRYIITDLCSLPSYVRHRNHYWLRQLTLDSTNIV